MEETIMETVTMNSAAKDIWKIPGTEELLTTEEIHRILLEAKMDSANEYEFGVGTDSQIIGYQFQFISVICVYKRGKGGTYYYSREWLPRKQFPVENQKLRMFEEVAKSIAIAMRVQEKINLPMIVHIDASKSDKREFTARFSDQLKGYVQSAGFECRLKPESYVACCIADRHTKKLRRHRRRHHRVIQ